MKAMCFVLTLFVAGCSSNIYPNQLEDMSKMCAHNGELKVVSVEATIITSTIFVHAYCEDGAEVQKSIKPLDTK